METAVIADNIVFPDSFDDLITAFRTTDEANYRAATINSCAAEVEAEMFAVPLTVDPDHRTLVLHWFDPSSAANLTSTGFMANGQGNAIAHYRIEKQDAEGPELLSERKFERFLPTWATDLSMLMFRRDFVLICAVRLLHYKQQMLQRVAAFA